MCFALPYGIILSNILQNFDKEIILEKYLTITKSPNLILLSSVLSILYVEKKLLDYCQSNLRQDLIFCCENII